MTKLKLKQGDTVHYNSPNTKVKTVMEVVSISPNFVKCRLKGTETEGVEILEKYLSVE